MIGEELAFIRKQLGRASTAERKVIAEAIGLHWKTLNRLATKETKYGRTDTVGKLAMYFRTKERRK
jgi:hypothetical protein